ncbi:MAG TPA: cysteine desulfurase [Candidatus Polarisedimenticolaceae bacterium]|nr:cysteine desulfurase [Candidatus Polarisedimenticolaceae bacterium]
MSRAPVTAFDLARVRKDFPILERTMRGRPLVYLDNANSTQKPRTVIETEARFYTEQYANIHRGVYLLSQEATAAYDRARERVARFVNARSTREIVFVRGTTEAINLVASSWGRKNLKSGDEVLISEMEHHSGIVPWQLACEAAGAKLRVIPVTDAGELDLEAAERLFTPKTKILSLIHISNALGTVNPVAALVAMAKRRDVPVLLDGAQTISHKAVDVQALGCDFYCFSGHKLFGPTGIGVLWAREDLLDAMPPYHGGGNMIHQVTFEKTTYAPLPFKFEAGTTNIAGTIGLAAAIDYVDAIGYDAIGSHEHRLLERLLAGLKRIPQVRVLGAPKERIGVVSLVLDGVHPHDAGTVLDLEGIAIRAGHHCVQPLMARFGVPASIRVSLAFYNTEAEVDAFLAGLAKCAEVFKG